MCTVPRLELFGGMQRPVAHLSVSITLTSCPGCNRHQIVHLLAAATMLGLNTMSCNVFERNPSDLPRNVYKDYRTFGLCTVRDSQAREPLHDN